MKRRLWMTGLAVLCGCATDAPPVLDRTTEARYARAPAWRQPATTEPEAPAPVPSLAPEPAVAAAPFEPGRGEIASPRIEARAARLSGDTEPTPGAAARRRVAERTMSRLNTLRADAGLGPLDLDPALMAVAQDRARALAAQEQPPAPRRADAELSSRLAREGIEAGRAESLVALGYPRLDEALAAWLADPEDRERLLSAEVSAVGFGFVQDPATPYFSYIELLLAGE